MPSKLPATYATTSCRRAVYGQPSVVGGPLFVAENTCGDTFPVKLALIVVRRNATGLASLGCELVLDTGRGS